MLVTKDNCEEILKKFQYQKVIFFDIETTGLEVYDIDKVIGIGIGLCNGERAYFPFRHVNTNKNVPIKYLTNIIQLLNNASHLIAHNIKFDLGGLVKEGLVVDNQTLIDTLVMSRLASRGKFPDLDLVAVTRSFVNPTEKDQKEELNKYKKERKIKSKGNEEVDPTFMAVYCCNDVRQLYSIYFALMKIIVETNQEKTFNLEIETTKTLFFMESYGSKIDPEYCIKIHGELDKKIVSIEKKIYDITKLDISEHVNVLSNLQLGNWFKSIGIHSSIKTPKGKECWNAKALILIDHPISGLIKEYRTLRKLRDTYFTPFLGKEILHPSFKNWKTVTGRLSCGNPNLQNIPRFQTSLDDKPQEMDEEKRKKIIAMASLRNTAGGGAAGGSSLSSWGFTGDEAFSEDSDIVSVRRLFVAREGYSLFSFDFSQMEMRIFIGYFSNKEIFKAMKEDDFDFHSFVATNVFGYDRTHKDFKFWRQIGKAISFGLIYGMGDDLLAAQMDRSLKEAKKFRTLYFNNLKGSKDFINEVNKKVRSKGFVFNRYGRIYFLPPERSYVGVNYLVQGTTGDLVKDRTNHVFKYLKDKKSKVVNSIHDELLIEIHKDEENEVVKEIKKILETNDLGIPLKVDVLKCYPSWANKKE